MRIRPYHAKCPGKGTVEQRNMHAVLRRAGANHAILTLESWGVLRGRADVRAA